MFCKNLISRLLLSKTMFKLVFESNKFVMTKRALFVEKGYLNYGLFKLNITVYLYE